MLEIRTLVKVYPGPVAALQGVSLEASRGMLGLLGPNGAGKTTLMRIVAGLLEPTSGAVYFDGEDVAGDPRRIRRKLGYLPQHFGFYPHLAGAAMLRFLLVLKGVHAPQGVKRLADELLERVNLRDAARRKVGTWSGGMRQRLGVAQALAGDPRIVVVDEPTAGLDPEERLRFYRLLAEVAEDRLVLLSTHIVEDISVLCPRVVVLTGGRIVADTTPRGARARLEGAIFEGAVEKDRMADLADRCEVTQAVLIEGRNRVRVHVPDGAPPEGFEPVAPSLEDAYLLLTRNRGAENGVAPPAGAERVAP
ncbi:MAG: ABC transporter ATP-binding protein [Acidobacteria bacterium]|nr:ABC transporter ATP-binding protein [Acidobacteriota bacterium]MXZ61308.1 ABC transporter ATP-binding protein [Acidobacteriota bacterium]MYF14808.1 ABC transporter ATP-binding protein [Acidobacteriota bacterium]MYI95830.1 ABC transporter ATP-binding protein [Acidobacteriota bacterium]